MKPKMLPVAPAPALNRDDHEVAFPRKLARAKALLAKTNLSRLAELTPRLARPGS